MRYFATLGLWVLLSVSAHAQTLHADMQKNYGQMKSFKASFTQRLTHKESGAVEERTGSLLFQKPLLVRWETVKPHPELLVVTDKEIWDYLPDEGVAYRYSPELVQDSRSLIQVITGQARLDQDFTIKQAGEEGSLRKLHLYPKEPVPQLVEAIIWVDPATKLIRKAHIIDFYGNSNEVTFTEIIPNAALGTKPFAFTPPTGVEVEDQIGKGLQERELFK